MARSRNKASGRVPQPPAASFDAEPETVHDAVPQPALAFPVVCVGASAGGLEAFTQLLSALPTDTGMAFVLVSHLSPSHASHLAEILSRATQLPVNEVKDEPKVQPNCVYVIPPDSNMIIAQGSLKLIPRHKVDGRHHPIDLFLESFAHDESAAYEGMPRSALMAGTVDFRLAPADIARELGKIARHAYIGTDGPPERIVEGAQTAPILRLLHQSSGVDFTHYKTATLRRRVARRMALHKVETLAEYAEYLRDRPVEIEALFQDILINVTSFFRDPETFELLKTRVFPRIVAEHGSADAIRMWVVGCSTGEEAYSLAIVFSEFMEREGRTWPVQIFATDLN